MSKAEKERQKELNASWREGYDMGVKFVLEENKRELAIGGAIMDAISSRLDPIWDRINSQD